MSSVGIEEKMLIAALHGEEHQRARNELVKKYQTLVRYIASKYAVNADYLDELIQIGSIGLIKAIDRFDSTRGAVLSTYATIRIHGEIKDYLRTLSPRRLYELAVRLENARQVLTSITHKPTTAELAEFVGVSVERAEAALCLRLGTVSLDDEISQGVDGIVLKDTIGKEDGALLQSEYAITLELINFSVLSERESRVLHLRFYEDRTLDEIAQEMGCTESRISQIVKGALTKIKANIGTPVSKTQPRESIGDKVLGLGETERALAQEAINALRGIGGQANTYSMIKALQDRGISKEALLFALMAEKIQFNSSGIWKTTSPVIIIPSIQEIIGVNMSLIDRMLITLLNHGQKAERRILRETVRNQDGPLSIPKNAKFASILHDSSKRGMVEIEGGKDSSLIIPLVTRDDVLKKYRKKMLKQKDQEERERLSRPVITDPRLEQLLSQSLPNIATLLTILLQYGTKGTTYQNLRDLFGKVKPKQSRRFAKIVRKATTSHSRFRKPVIIRVKADTLKLDHDIIKPLIGLDELIEVSARTKPKQPKRERRLIKPVDYDPLIDELARIPLLNRQEKILLVLWKFGHEGTDRWTLRKMIKQEDETLRMSGKQLRDAMWLAAHPINQSGVLVEIDDTFIPDDQIIRPLMTLEELSAKYQDSEGGVGKYCFGEQ